MYAEWIRKADTRRLTYIDTSFLGEPGTGTLKPRLTSKNTQDSLPDYHMGQDGKRMLYNCYKKKGFSLLNPSSNPPSSPRSRSFLSVSFAKTNKSSAGVGLEPRIANIQ